MRKEKNYRERKVKVKDRRRGHTGWRVWRDGGEGVGGEGERERERERETERERERVPDCFDLCEWLPYHDWRKLCLCISLWMLDHI